mmetsp:Transcript_87744/g.256498  ORF Transcript_87744/g.256498 Transcript_87744/m.256498 type:complete len:599 (+) Transcript_87744:1318-3114(+)
MFARPRYQGQCSAAEPAHGPRAARASHGDAVKLPQMLEAQWPRPALVERPEPGLVAAGPVEGVAPELRAGVGAAEAEAVEAGDVVVPVEVEGLLGEGAWEPFQLDVLVQDRQVDRGGDGRVQQRHQRSQQAVRAGGGLLVAQVRLGARHRNRAIPSTSEDAPDRAHFDGVTKCGASPVVLVRRRVGGADVPVPHGRPHAELLRRAVGRREAGAPAVLVHGAADDAAEAVRVLDLVAVHLDEGGAAALAPLVPVRAHVEGEAAALVGRPAHGALAHEGHRPHERVDANDDSPFEYRLSRSDAALLVSLVRHVVMCNVERDQRGRARSGNRVCGTYQIQEVRQARSRDAGIDAAALLGEIALDHIWPPGVRGVPIRPNIPDLDADQLSGSLAPAVACTVQRLIPRLQDDSLAWVEAHRLVFGQAEEDIVEAVELHLVQESAMVHVRLSRHHGPVSILLVVQVSVPASARPLHDAIGPADKHVPVVVVAPASSGHPYHQGLDQRLLTLGLPRASQAQALSVVLLLSLDASQLDAGQSTQEPRLKCCARALWVVGVTQRVMAENQHLVTAHGQRNILSAARLWVENDIPRLTFKHKNDCNLP